MRGMAKIHATLTPLNITDPKKEILVLKFDSPTTARDVRVQLVESDANESGRDDLIGIFEGKIVKPCRFKGRLIREGEAAPASPSFKFQFEDDAIVYDLKIPSGRGEQEHGAYEICVKIDGIVAGRPSNFISKAPAYIRGLPQADAVAQHRPVLTFLGCSAKKGKDLFYRGARLFWDPVSDNKLTYVLALEQIIDFLNKNATRKTRDGLEYGDWGEINIVSHANEEGWTSLLLFKPSKTQEEVAVDAKSLEDNKTDPRLAVTSKNVDDKTHIVWRGCNVGRNQEFLNKVRELFGGKCRVSAPKYIQWYEVKWSLIKEPKKKPVKVIHAWEYFVENFYFDLPWPVPEKRKLPPEKRKLPPKKPKLPKVDACAARLEAKYPGKATAPQWKTLIKNKKSRHDSERPLVFNSTVKLQEKEKSKKVARERLQAYRAPGFRYEDYYWRIGNPVVLKENEDGYSEGYRWKVLCRGTKYRLEVRRPLRDVNKNIVVPSLSDPGHYGHSPP